MITISLCMIVKDEQETLERCLECVEGIADEIIVVDTGSSDRTKEIASGFTDKVFDFEWIDDFSAARNFSYSHAGMDYILWLDADDVILPGDAEQLKRLKETLDPDIDVVMMKYNAGFDAQGRTIFSYFRERLSKRSRGFQWREPVHEYLEVWGKRIDSDIAITHAKPHGRPGGRNLQIYEALIQRGGALSPRGMYYYARELKDCGRFADAIRQFQFFLDTKKGWVEDNIAACGELARCYLADNQPDHALSSLLRSLMYGPPRAEICCQLGYFFMESQDYRQSAYWFEQALHTRQDENNWGFRLEDCRGFIPCIELAVAYDKLGEYAKAAEFNRMALEYKPESHAALSNQLYFQNRINNHSI